MSGEVRWYCCECNAPMTDQAHCYCKGSRRLDRTWNTLHPSSIGGPRFCSECGTHLAAGQVHYCSKPFNPRGWFIQDPKSSRLADQRPALPPGESTMHILPEDPSAPLPPVIAPLPPGWWLEWSDARGDKHRSRAVALWHAETGVMVLCADLEYRTGLLVVDPKEKP